LRQLVLFIKSIISKFNVDLCLSISLFCPLSETFLFFLDVLASLFSPLIFTLSFPQPSFPSTPLMISLSFAATRAAGFDHSNFPFPFHIKHAMMKNKSKEKTPHAEIS
jgi:hypothetical protein